MPAAWLPYISLGMGIAQYGQAQRYAQEATAGLSPEQRTRARTEGTSNIQSHLASRGLLDSSLYSGGLAALEQQIAEARNPNADLLWQMAMGQGQGGSETIGNLMQLYMLRQLYGQGGGFGNLYDPWDWNKAPKWWQMPPPKPGSGPFIDPYPPK